MMTNFTSLSAMLFKLIIAMLFALQSQENLADRVVAIVNDEPILLSELYSGTARELQGVTGRPPEIETRLEGKINQTLILQEVRRLKIFSVSRAEVEQFRQQMIESAGGREQMLAEMQSRGIPPDAIDAYIERRLLINKFIDYRFRREVVIEDEEIGEYYSGEFTSNYRADNPGRPLPPLRQVRSAIETLLTERRVNDALEEWLTQARSRARIVIKF